MRKGKLGSCVRVRGQRLGREYGMERVKAEMQSVERPATKDSAGKVLSRLSAT